MFLDIKALWENLLMCDNFYKCCVCLVYRDTLPLSKKRSVSVNLSCNLQDFNGLASLFDSRALFFVIVSFGLSLHHAYLLLLCLV